MSNVSGIIKSIQDIMRKDVGVDGDAQRISQLVWMFFLKIFDDREAELELLEDDYKSPLPEHLRWRNWATDPEGMTGEALMRLRQQPAVPDAEREAGHPRSHRRTRPRHPQRVRRRLQLHEVRHADAPGHQQDLRNRLQQHRATATPSASIYEQILRDLQSAGNAGEFYTPRAVTRFMVESVDPKLDEIVLDPACGTGGFLTCTIDHKREHYVKTKEDEETLVKSHSWRREEAAAAHAVPSPT